MDTDVKVNVKMLIWTSKFIHSLIHSFNIVVDEEEYLQLVKEDC